MCFKVVLEIDHKMVEKATKMVSRLEPEIKQMWTKLGRKRLELEPMMGVN